MSVNTDFILNVPPVPETIFDRKDLACPIALRTMNKVATLVCGHSFEQTQIQQVFKDSLTAKCPVCRQVTQVVPSNEELQQMIDQAARRTALQRACDAERVAHPDATEMEDTATTPGISQGLQPIENGPHIAIRIDTSGLPAHLHLRIERLFQNIEETGDDWVVHTSRQDTTYPNESNMSFLERVNPHPDWPTEFFLSIETIVHQQAREPALGIHIEEGWERPEWVNHLVERFNQSFFGRWLRS